MGKKHFSEEQIAFGHAYVQITSGGRYASHTPRKPAAGETGRRISRPSAAHSDHGLGAAMAADHDLPLIPSRFLYQHS